MTPKISIIVPVYNIDIYLEECLESIINQTFSDIEIILIDDGSTDCSLGIMHFFANKDQRVKIYSQLNQGVSVTRNKGILQAQGEYILFVDGDDKIEKKAIEILYQCATTTNAELVIGNASYWYPNGDCQLAFNRGDLNNLFGLSGEICFEKLMEKLSFPPLVYLFFVKRELLLNNQLFFAKGIIHEDELWCVKTMFNSKRVSLLDFNYYFYRQRKGSIMKSSNEVYRIESILFVSNELAKLALELKNKKVSDHIIGFIYQRIIIQFYVIGVLFIKDYLHFIPKFGFYAELLQSVYSSLSYPQQRYCLHLYCNTISSILIKSI